MENTNQKRYLRGLAIYALIFLILLMITNVTPINAWINGLMFIFRPVLIGLILAYLANSFFRLFERKLFVKIRPFPLRRGISLFFTYLSILLIFAILLMLIVPQLFGSILDFINNADSHIDRTVGEVNKLIESLNQKFPSDNPNEPTIPPLEADGIKEGFSGFVQSIKLDNKTLLEILNLGTVTSIFGVAENILRITADIILGCFISFYLLHTKEKRYAQIMRMRHALLSDRVNETITRICETADRSFGGFIKGKMLDSCMVGIMVYLVISLMNVPYAILIAVIIGVTDFVPVIGPFIGVIPSAIIILLTDPGKVIPFLICILVVQQIDGNIVAPKILGENTGVSSLCVMIAITTMGALWGLVGMVIGVPLFATVLELAGDWLDRRLEKKGLVEKTEAEPAAAEDDPLADGGTVFRRLQTKYASHYQQQAIGGMGDLTAIERLKIETYALIRKYRVDTQRPEELPPDFVQEEKALTEAAVELAEEEIVAEIAEEAAAEAAEALSNAEATELPADLSTDAPTADEESVEDAPDTPSDKVTDGSDDIS